MILALAILGFLTIFILCALYFPRTAVSISAVYFFMKISGLMAALETAVSGFGLALIWTLSIVLTIAAFRFDIHKFKANPFKKD
ncbi:MAG: hypothetical protein Q8N42_00335 [bacterium]|nr:hypothetical protein [bacterium]